MKLHVKVVEGRDLLRSPLDRCGPYGDGDAEVADGDDAVATPVSPQSPSRDGPNNSHNASNAAPSPYAFSSNNHNGAQSSSSLSSFASSSTASTPTLTHSSSSNPKRKHSTMSSMRRFALAKMRSPLLGRGGSHRRSNVTIVQTGKPFVRLKVKGDERTTSLGDDISKWKWNEEFVFDVTGVWGDEDMPDNDVSIEIEVRDSVKCQNYGFVKIPLKRLSGSGLVEQWYQLQRQPRTLADDDADAVLIASAVANQYLNETDGGGSAPTSPNNDDINSDSHGATTRYLADTLANSDRDLESCGVLYLSLHFETEIEDEDRASIGSAAISLSSLSSRGSSPRRTTVPRLKLDSTGQVVQGSPRNKGARTRSVPVRLADYVVLARFSRNEREPELAERFPKEDHHDLFLPVKLEWFIFAFGKKAEAFISSSKHTVMGKPVDIFAFVHAPRGVAMFGYCIMYHDKEKDATACMCILSRLNTGDMFRDVLLDMHEACMLAAQDGREHEVRKKLAHRLIHDIPMPLPGELRIEFNLRPESPRIFQCELPPLGAAPRLTFSEGLEFLIRKLGVQLLVSLWGALLLETKLIMHSRKQRELSITGETLLALLYPFRWHHTYISVLPPQLTECLQAPFPFVLGLHSDLVEKRDKILDHELNHALILDLDRGIVRKGAGLHIEPLPRAEARRLERMLCHAINLNPSALDDPMDEQSSWEDSHGEHLISLTPEMTRKAQLCFLECICQMLQGYRECLFFLNESMPVFNTPKFLERRASEASFFSHLLETQAFENFKEIQYSKWLETFHAYFFRVRVRNRNKEQYLALANQKRVVQERRRAAVADPDSRDFDGATRSRTIPGDEITLKRRDARNENAMSLMIQRLSTGNNAPGLDPLTLEAPDEDEPEAKDQDSPSAYATWDSPPIAQALYCTITDENPKGVASSLDLQAVATETGADVEALRESLRDLRIITGTQNFHEHGFDALQLSEFASDAMESEVDEILSDMDLKLRERSRSRSRSRSDSAAKKGASPYEPNYVRERSKRDRRIELTLQECITKIFLNKSVEQEQLEKCGNAFMTSKHARDLFVLILYQPQHRSVSSYSYTYGSRGRGLREAAFNALVKLCCDLIEACYRREDYPNARQMLEVSQSYYLDRSAPVAPVIPQDRSPMSPTDPMVSPVTGIPRRGSMDAFGNPSAPVPHEDYLDAHLQGLELWKSLLFWEDAFAETMSMEMRKRNRSHTVGGTTSLNEVVPIGARNPVGDSSSSNSVSPMENTASASVAGDEGDSEAERHASLGGPATSNKSLAGGSSPMRIRRMSSPTGGEGAYGSFVSHDDRGSPKNGDAAPGYGGVDQDTLFKLASTMVHQMIRIGAPEDKAKALVSRVVTQYGLIEEHEEVLYMLITNVSRAVEVSQSMEH
mmetsp:Transcript_479/g.1157  ORF Transcript_479/g.1157 Transcript_479/m.1157 type:complete len:1404 (-) Transcript_479:141-4352(-)